MITKTKFELKLKSGLVVPVSRKYQLKVSEAVWDDIRHTLNLGTRWRQV